MAAATPTAPTTTTTAPTHTKVFVGNLSYRTKDAGLKESFVAANLAVVSANIISRGNRSMGYGFVEFETEAEAKRAVELMNKKEVDGRDINVELANPRDESENRAPRPPSAGGFRGGRGRGGRGRGRGGRGRGGYFGGGGPAGAGGGRGSGWIPRGRGRGGRGRGRGRGRGGYFGGGAGYSRRQGSPSTTTLFVANLPFAMEDGQLSEIFAGNNVKQAHVVKRPNGRSKGFGFVEFNTQEDQQAALNAAKSKVVNGRELIVKVALSSQDGPGKPEGEGQDAGAAAPAPAGAPAAAPAPTPAPAANPAPAATPETKKEEKTGN